MRLKCCTEDFKESDTEQGFERINPTSFTITLSILFTNEIGMESTLRSGSYMNIKGSNRHCNILRWKMMSLW